MHQALEREIDRDGNFMTRLMTQAASHQCLDLLMHTIEFGYEWSRKSLFSLRIRGTASNGRE